MVVRMRVNRSKSGKRRSHHGLLATRTTKCECGALRLNHRACAECGRYNGKVALDVVSRAARDARRLKRREKNLRAAGQATSDTKEKEPTQT